MMMRNSAIFATALVRGCTMAQRAASAGDRGWYAVDKKTTYRAVGYD